MFDDSNQPSDLQRRIVQTADRNPDMDPAQIADVCDCSESYVRQTLKEYRGGLLDFDFGSDLL